jgi:hypothetical protein
MKTTTDNHIDKLLHEAMKQRAAKVPPLADDFAEKVMKKSTSLPLSPSKGKSLTPRPLQGERELKRRRLWPWMCAIAASIIVAFFLWPNSPAVVEQPVVAEVVEQPAPEAPKASDYSESSDKPTPSKATNPKRTCEDNKPIKPQDEPLLAETETPAHDDIDIAAELADLKNEINELEYLYLSCNN